MSKMADLATNMVKACNPDPTKSGKILLVLNALGMVFAAASNTFAAAIDKNTSAEDKKFLVPAGAVTGAANIGIYYLMTNKIIKKLQGVADNIVKAMPSVKLEENALNYVNKIIAKKEKGLFGTGLFKNLDLAKSMKENLLENGKPTALAIDKFKGSMKSGAGVLGAFAGALIGCSIITPIIRDISAYFVQKKIEKNNPEMKDKPYMIYYDPSHIGSGRYGRKEPLSMTSYMTFTSGGMKI